jgi:hypothetical protein
MKERPILFSGQMVRAILDGRKTQTRRIVKPQPSPSLGLHPDYNDVAKIGRNGRKPDQYGIFDGEKCIPCPYGAPGDRLWVRETFRHVAVGQVPSVQYGFAYQADGAMKLNPATTLVGFRPSGPLHISSEPIRWRPSIHMPRWASRITLEIKYVGVERLHDIDIDDIAHEGLQSTEFMPKLKWAPMDGYIHGDDHEAVRDGWRRLWESINGADSWAANPYVWVIEFKRIEQEASR